MRTTTEQIEVNAENCSGCKMCQLICSFIYTRKFNPLKSRIVIEEPNTTEPFSITFTDECNDCGFCVRYCFYDALKIKEQR